MTAYGDTVTLERKIARNQRIVTPHGYLESVWTCNGLFGLAFVGTPLCAAIESSLKRIAGSDGEVFDAGKLRAWQTTADSLHSQFNEYFGTGKFQVDLSILDWSGLTDFTKAVLKACSQIPAGKTARYGELAAAVGSPKAARAVGAVMARNRWPILIPCHRVVGSGGQMVGYSGAGGVDTKRALLQLENRLR